MWAKLIEIIEKRWHESKLPRKQLAKSMAELYSDMNKCHQAYLDFKERWDAHDPNQLHQLWSQAFVTFLLSLDRLDSVLSIYSPTARDLLQRYAAFDLSLKELHERTIDGHVEMLSNEFGNPISTMEAVSKLIWIRKIGHRDSV